MKENMEDFSKNFVACQTCAEENVLQFIPRIHLIPSNIPFNFKRSRLPVKLYFAFAISKAQRQFLKMTGDVVLYGLFLSKF